MTAQDAAKRFQQRSESVDWKHPDGRRAGQAEISSAKSVKSSEDHLKKPAKQPAMNIVVDKFFHSSRISGQRHSIHG